MTQWEYTYLWWEASATPITGSRPGPTGPPINQEALDELNTLGASGWELVTITAAPLSTAWVSPGGRFGVTGITDKVHYLATLRRPARR